MPWVVRKSSECPAKKPWGVFNQTTGRKVACHASKPDANAQMRALYANAGSEATNPAARRRIGR